MTSPFERHRRLGAERGREAGFTLIEVIVTLAILSIALTLIVGYKPPWSGIAAGSVGSDLAQPADCG
jgi:prepilin-type N-terminal cleavage/methylation domain-containing protein